MKTNQELVSEFMEAAGQNVSKGINLSVSDEECILKAKLLLEEALETVYALGVDINLDFQKTNSKIKTTDDIELTKVRDVDIVEVADGCADVDYVNMGIANTFGINHQNVFNEVHRSNMSKFIDGYRRDDGKWIKGPSYSPANIFDHLE